MLAMKGEGTDLSQLAKIQHKSCGKAFNLSFCRYGNKLLKKIEQVLENLQEAGRPSIICQGFQVRDDIFDVIKDFGRTGRHLKKM